jgi:hypothetical protein
MAITKRRYSKVTVHRLSCRLGAAIIQLGHEGSCTNFLS